MTRYRFGANAGGAFLPNGDLWMARWVTMPNGELKALVTVGGFRDMPEGRRKVILDRYFVDPPKGAVRGR
jgi:hypothetical protein